MPAATEGARSADAHAALAGDAAPMSDAGLLAFIFRRNLTVYVWLLAGLLSAGAVTFVVLLVNGIMLGNTIGLAYDAGVAPATLIDLLLPHGMLEVGTFCIAGAVGFQGFRIVFDWERNGWGAVRSLRLGLVFRLRRARLGSRGGAGDVRHGCVGRRMDDHWHAWAG